MTELSSDGAVLIRAVGGALGIGPLDLPWADEPRLWRPEDIEAHLPFFKDYAPAAGLLAGGSDESSARGRWFNHGEGGAAAEDRSVSSDSGGNGKLPPEIPKERPPTREVAGQDLSCISISRPLTFTQAGVVLGRGTLLSEFEKKGLAAGGLALDGNEARLLSLLTAAYR